MKLGFQNFNPKHENAFQTDITDLYILYVKEKLNFENIYFCITMEKNMKN